MEIRDVAAINIPNAILKTDIKKDGEEIAIILVLRGKLALLMIKTAPKVYERHVTKRHVTKDKNANMILYERLLKARYAIMQASLLFYTTTIENLQNKSCVMNPYDPFVANKMIKGNQCTIIYHDDDMDISHPDSYMVSSIIDLLIKGYTRLSPMERFPK